MIVDAKPLTLIVRLWHRPEGLRAELKPLHSDERLLFKTVAELLEYLEQLSEKTEE